MQRGCRAQGCERDHHARGLCSRHYKQLQREAVQRMTPRAVDIIRVPLPQVEPSKRAAAWASQQRFDAACELLHG